MPDLLRRVANIAALAERHPLEDVNPPWKFRFCPYTRGRYTIGLISDGAAGGVQHAVQIGTTEVVQMSDTTIGGTDGVIPTPYGAAAGNTAPFHTFMAEKDDEIDLAVFERGNVATTDVMFWANVEPVIP
jgi:hypothetical protein